MGERLEATLLLLMLKLAGGGSEKARFSLKGDPVSKKARWPRCVPELRLWLGKEERHLAESPAPAASAFSGCCGPIEGVEPHVQSVSPERSC